MSLESALAQFSTQPLLEASRALFKDTLHIPLSPLADAAITPKRFFGGHHKEDKHRTIRHLHLVGRVDDRAFQAAQELLSPEALDLEAAVKESAEDYDGMFLIAVEMAEGEFARGDLAARTREINRVFTNPVIVLFKHLQQKQPVLSIGVISRREHKRTQGAHVLGKVSMIREIRPENPHRGHLEILKDFSLAELEKNAGKGKRGHKIDSFKSFHAALEAVFNIELLNERFYRELANWYFWALPQVEFPADLEPDSEKRRATGLIRLLTRLIFCWFLKEKDLIPEKLFHPAALAKLLNGFDPESETSSTYYQAILQNLFFATLNQRMGKDSKGNPHRLFATDEGFPKNRATYDVNNLYRYEQLFAVPEDQALALFADIPFLNGGLFECLDRTEDGTDRKRYLDGFSRNAKKRPHIPDRLFFDSGETTDLSTAYGDKKRKAEQVTGLISILNRYKFTIVENTPIDQEIALDPELLGKVFENLLASYNEETKTTARKQTGSFYTPRPIVDYMVDESLKAHLTRKLEEAHAKARSREEGKELEMSSASESHSTSASPTETTSSETLRAFASSRETRLDHLFAYTEEPHQFTDPEVATLIAAIDGVKILDPACGSGAFPMGVLHKLVYILGKLDPDNDRWKQTQLAKLDSAPMREELERAFEENNDDYGRKLYLIENCLYGVDIQPIAIQITKLRFFISLVCDQKTNRNKKDNHGIRPLPNLETKFVAADTLIGLPIPEPDLFLKSLIEPIEKEIEAAYHGHFTIQRRDQKLALQKKIKALRQKLTDTLLDGLGANKGSEVAKKAQHLAEWDPFDPQSTADFFDPHWMFGRSLKDGFDVVIGNPPYGIKYSKPGKSTLTVLFPKGADIADSYAYFILKGLDLLRNSGSLVFITPNTFCDLEKGVEFRKHLLTETTIFSIWQSGWVFSAAIVDTLVMHLSRRPPKPEHTISVLTDRDLESRPQSLFLEMPLNKIDFRTSVTRLALRDQIRKRTVELSRLFTVKAGVKLYELGKGNPPQTQEVVVSKPFTAMGRNDAGWSVLVRGGDVDRYSFSHRTEYVRYGPWLAAPRDSEMFSKPKILMRRTDDRLRSNFDRTGAVAVNSCHVIQLKGEPHNDEQKYLSTLALLNSSVCQWAFETDNPQMIGKTFSEIKVIYAERLPIPILSQTETQLLAFLSKSLILLKGEATAETPHSSIATFLEDLIDACVMECYFREHMAERDLLFHDTVAQILEETHAKPRSREEEARESEVISSPEFLRDFVSSCETSPIRNRLDRLCTASPDLLAIIKQEGKV